MAARGSATQYLPRAVALPLPFASRRRTFVPHVKTCIICNPAAGSAGEAEALRAQLERFESPSIQMTTASGDATRLAREAVAEGCGTVIAAGGDGTLNEVINGVAEHASDVVVGLLPLGTGNDFARMLNLPSSVGDCVDVLRQQRMRPIDLVRVTSDCVRYFINVSAGGFSGSVGEKMTPEIKQTWGPLAYLRCAAEALPDLQPFHTQITLDGATTLDLDLYNVVVANGRYVAGGTLIAPEAKVDDGLLDLVLVPAAEAGALAMIAARIALGQHLESDGVIFRRAATVAVQSTPGMWFNVDGELVGNEPAVFEVMPRALRFLTGDLS